MLTFRDRRLDRNCQTFARREFLKIGALGFGGGLTLPGLLAARSAAAAAGGSYVRDRSVVLLFLQGGPPHIEMFDPKMTAPVEIRSITGEVATTLPGITFGGTMPQLASRAHKFTVVRSYGSNNNDHTYGSVVTAGNPLKASASSIYARVAGNNHPANGMPRNVLVLPEAVSPGLKLGSNFETGALPTLTTPGELNPSFAAFNPTGGGQLKSNMELTIPRARFDDRRYLLAQLDRVRRDADTSGMLDGIDRYQQQAFDLITGGVADAFDLSKEDPATVARYDTSSLFGNDQVQRWFDMKRATNLLGKQLLMARRLCEAGCGFVTVSDCGWDFHSNSNSPKNLGGMHLLGPQVDHAVSAFIDDLEARGLRDKILLIVTGEMGRTPRINNNGGRDHYGKLTSLAFYGGALKMGQVIGQSDRHATEPATTAYRPEHLLSTIMHVLFDLGALRLDTGLPREITRLADGPAPIEPLFS
jgi:hypothetical protein